MIPNFLVYFMQFLLIELRSRGPPSNQPHDPQSQTIFYFSHRTCMRRYFFFPFKSIFRWFAYKLLLGHSPNLFIFSGPYKSRKDAVSSVFALENQWNKHPDAKGLKDVLITLPRRDSTLRSPWALCMATNWQRDKWGVASNNKLWTVENRKHQVAGWSPCDSYFFCTCEHHARQHV